MDIFIQPNTVDDRVHQVIRTLRDTNLLTQLAEEGIALEEVIEIIVRALESPRNRNAVADIGGKSISASLAKLRLLFTGGNGILSNRARKTVSARQLGIICHQISGAIYSLQLPLQFASGGNAARVERNLFFNREMPEAFTLSGTIRRRLFYQLDDLASELCTALEQSPRFVQCLPLLERFSQLLGQLLHPSWISHIHMLVSDLDDDGYYETIVLLSLWQLVKFSEGNDLRPRRVAEELYVTPKDASINGGRIDATFIDPQLATRADLRRFNNLVENNPRYLHRLCRELNLKHEVPLQIGDYKFAIGDSLSGYKPIQPVEISEGGIGKHVDQQKRYLSLSSRYYGRRLGEPYSDLPIQKANLLYVLPTGVVQKEVSLTADQRAEYVQKIVYTSGDNLRDAMHLRVTANGLASAVKRRREQSEQDKQLLLF